MPSTGQAKEDGETKKAKSDNPVPLSFNLGKCALVVKETCGQCIHFKRIAYPAYKFPCIQKGIIRESKPCDKFAVNPALIKFTESKHARMMSQVARGLNSSELKLLSVLINQEERTRRQGFSFGEIVYFRAFGDDYISNYIKARVVWADKQHVHLEGADGCIATLYKISVLKEKQWLAKELTLLKKNRIKDPNRKKYTKLPSKEEQQVRKILDKVAPTNLTADTRSKVFQSQQSTKVKRSSSIMPLDKVLTVR